MLEVDEIALDYENCAKASWQLVSSGELTEATHASILALDHAIEDIGPNAADWTPAAFTASVKWARIRADAATILEQLKQRN